MRALLVFQNHTSAFHHLSNVGARQLCALKHLGCTHTSDGHFELFTIGEISTYQSVTIAKVYCISNQVIFF